MFDIGFSELLLLSLLGLVVIGPERLPTVARQLGRWLGLAKAQVRQLQKQLETEVKLEELNREILRQEQAQTQGEDNDDSTNTDPTQHNPRHKDAE